MKSKVTNMVSSKGNPVPNQFIIYTTNDIRFQSYASIIAIKSHLGKKTVLDKKAWNYSAITGKYRNIFLGETKKETQKKIDNGIYKLKNLNK